MRIAVCAPQVPFVRGGAEIMADTLVAELRARDHEAELVTIPFKWYPGTRVLDQAFLWRLLDLTESDGRPIDLVRRDEVPLLLRPPSEQARLGAAPVPAGVRARPNRSGPVLRRTLDRALRRSVQLWTGSRSARRSGSSPPPATSPSGSSARPGSRRRCCRIRRRSCRTATTATATSSSRSAGSTGRSETTCCSRRPRSIRPPRRDRRRRPRPRAPRGARGRARAERACRFPGASTRTSSPRSTRAASPSTTRLSTRTSGWSRTRRSSPRNRC